MLERIKEKSYYDKIIIVWLFVIVFGGFLFSLHPNFYWTTIPLGFGYALLKCKKYKDKSALANNLSKINVQSRFRSDKYMTEGFGFLCIVLGGTVLLAPIYLEYNIEEVLKDFANWYYSTFDPKYK